MEAFLAMKEAGDFVEYAQVHGNYYGTSRAQLEKHLNDRRNLLLEIDVQGARQVKEHFPSACFIFVLPPDRETLEKRLLQRGTEQENDLERRLEDSSRVGMITRLSTTFSRKLLRRWQLLFWPTLPAAGRSPARPRSRQRG
jgi:guanylate kinase